MDARGWSVMRTPLRFLLAAVLLVALVVAGSVALAAPGKRSQRGAALAAAKIGRAHV